MGKDIEKVQVALYKARHHLREALDIAKSAGWANDEVTPWGVILRCADALDESLQRRFVEGGTEYTPSEEVHALLEIDFEEIDSSETN